jgi:hypothetical protein
MQNLIVAASLALAAACAATPDAPLAAAPPADASFEWHRTGEGTYIYHRVWGNCTTLGHGHGRNMAWGRWEMPLADVIDGGAEETGEGGALVRLTCRGGSACMRKGALSTATEPLSEHTVPFGTMALARQYTEAVAALKTACQLQD